MLQQLVEGNEHVSMETLNVVLDKERAAEYGVDRVPAVIIAAGGHDRIRYYGAPLGQELPTFVEAVRMTASGHSGLGDETRARLEALTAPVRIQVFFTPTCVFCPRMIALANQLAIESAMITAISIDATEYPDLVRRYNVTGVPKTVINDEIEIMGAVPEDELVRQILAIQAQGSGLRAQGPRDCD
jgi:glutaredoxin-like protein